MALGRLLARTIVGGLFIGHGTQKLFGWFGGHGLEGTSGFFHSIGLKPGRHHALAGGGSETVGGALLVAGAATPAAAALLGGTMLTAIRAVHWKNGPWSTEGGYEYNAVLLALLLVLVEEGPGPLSVDGLLGQERKGARWALAALGAGAAGSAIAMEYARRQAAKEAEQDALAQAETERAQAVEAVQSDVRIVA
jgi:putative oxidoreductase